ncbi:hypothetical protein M501DRAFT_972594 [Patellaria atrata CBS 101060]|uniref:Nuclear protein DGCR14 n=1 Tax=Patellaria atrata CBS 101060 TaxID=1346257 RepID=A0A9P4SDB7_9PEZI|nr:hypothetical protein M501DRAFT_972594 [Patellaria atrata CBS 101060]
MSSSNSQALVKRSSDTALMPPPPPPKRIKRPTTVLDEDTYTDALSHIIARDFFPGLLETQTQQEYLDAVESRDRDWIAEASKNLIEVMTPSPDGKRVRGRIGTSMTPLVGLREGAATPRGFRGETPGGASILGDAEDGEKKPEVDLNMSLSAFQAKYTSEDNESFNQLLDTANEKRREKYAWLWNNNKILAPRQIAHRAREAKLLEDSRSASELAEKYGEKEETQVTIYKDAPPRPAMPDTKPSAPRNAFMFPPDSIEDTHTTRFQAAEAASNMGPRALIRHNTRLPNPELPEDTATVPPSPSMSAVDDAIRGRPRATTSEAGYSGGETPRVKGYAFVDAEPAPGENERALQKPSSSDPPKQDCLLNLLTFENTSPSPFRLQQTSRREALHHRIVDSHNKARQQPSGGRLAELKEGTPKGRTLTPKFASAEGIGARGKREGNLTPAARALWERIGTPMRKGGEGFDGKSKAREKEVWTPKVKKRA